MKEPGGPSDAQDFSIMLSFHSKSTLTLRFRQVALGLNWTSSDA